MELKLQVTSVLNLVGATGRNHSLTLPLRRSPQRGFEPMERVCRPVKEGEWVIHNLEYVNDTYCGI